MKYQPNWKPAYKCMFGSSSAFWNGMLYPDSINDHRENCYPSPYLRPPWGPMEKLHIRKTSFNLSGSFLTEIHNSSKIRPHLGPCVPHNWCADPKIKKSILTHWFCKSNAYVPKC